MDEDKVRHTMGDTLQIIESAPYEDGVTIWPPTLNEATFKYIGDKLRCYISKAKPKGKNTHVLESAWT